MAKDMEQVKDLKKCYAEVCKEYLQAFCKNYDVQYDDDAWVAGENGTIAFVVDYYLDFHDVIKFAVDNNLSDWNEILEWYDYTLFAHEYGQNCPNFQNWHKGCPRLSKAERERLENLKKDFEAAVKDYKEIY